MYPVVEFGWVCILVPVCRDMALGLLLRLQDRLLTPRVGMSVRLFLHESSHLLNIGDGLIQSSSLVFVLNTRVKQIWAFGGKGKVCFIYLMHWGNFSSKATATPHSAVGHIHTRSPSLSIFPVFVSHCQFVQ